MTQPLPEEKLLSTFLSSFLKLQNVDRGSIWIRHEDRFLCVEAMGSQSEQIKGVSMDADQPSVVRWVIEKGQMTVVRPGADERHHSEIEAELDIKSTRILAFPLIMENGRVYGTLQLIDTSSHGDQLDLSSDYLELLQNLVNIGSIALSSFIDYHLQLEENKKLKSRLAQLRTDSMVIGKDPAFQALLHTAEQYARVDFPVLIRGESGSGKEVVAQWIHRISPRTDQPYVTQNCSAIPDTLLESELFGHVKGAFTGATEDKVGLFEAANQGTVFLDEIGDMPVNLQAKLLRVLQSGEIKPLGASRVRFVDVRIIAATHVDLETAVSKNRFREDLWYRLNVLPLNVPPLRDRPQDIPLLATYFMNRECRRLEIPQKHFTSAAMRGLVRRKWHGNVRELENLIRYMIASIETDKIDVEDLPELTHAPVRAEPIAANREKSVDASDVSSSFVDYDWRHLEKAYVAFLLERYHWNISRAADHAGLKRSTFNSRLQRLGFQK